MRKRLFCLVSTLLMVGLAVNSGLPQSPAKAPPKSGQPKSGQPKSGQPKSGQPKSKPPKSAPPEETLLDDVPVNQVGEFMRAKLDHSQKVLEGLAVEDYELIAKHSQELSLLSMAAGWQVLQTPAYAEYSADFRRTVDTMTEAGKNKNLDGATLAYVEMTMKCVTCHKYVRKVRMADSDATPLRKSTKLR